MLKRLRNELLGQEMNFMELDNYMMEEEFYSVCEDGVISDIKECGNVAYTNRKTGECEILISFEIVKDNEADELEGNFVIKITDIDNI